MTDDGAENLLAVGFITGSFGISGFVKVKPLTDNPGRFKKLAGIYRGVKPGEIVGDKIEQIEIRRRDILLKLGSISDKTAADRLKGQYIFIGSADAEPPREGRYYIHEVVGCTVQTGDNRKIGVVKEVYKMPTNDLWEIDDGKKTFMIPAVREFILSVDRKKRIITVHLIDGLMDT
jgi:16S rRNA processing protein RimM